MSESDAVQVAPIRKERGQAHGRPPSRHRQWCEEVCEHSRRLRKSQHHMVCSGHDLGSRSVATDGASRGGSAAIHIVPRASASGWHLVDTLVDALEHFLLPKRSVLEETAGCIYHNAMNCLEFG